MKAIAISRNSLPGQDLVNVTLVAANRGGKSMCIRYIHVPNKVHLHANTKYLPVAMDMPPRCGKRV